MGLLSKKLLGISITVSQKEEILEEIRKYLIEFRIQNSEFRIYKVKPLIIFTPNPEIISYAQKDHIFKEIVNSAQVNIPDGAGVAWGIDKKYRQKIEKISGADFMSELCKMSEDCGFTVGLIGGRSGVALEALECLRQSYNNLSGWAMDGPEIEIQNSEFRIQNYKNKDLNSELIHNSKFITINSSGKPSVKTEKYFESLAKELINKKIAILFIGLGCPKQEYFINKLKQNIEKISYQDNPKSKNLPNISYSRNLFNHGLVMMAVGGSFDYISGRVPRAPKWIRDRGFEWLYRLVKEPWRLHRQIKGAEFFTRVLLTR